MTFKIRHAVALACAMALPVSTWAAEAEESTGALEEIVITAQKRTERLADVPVAASVVSTESIAKLNVGDISDLNRLVPSVNLNGTINGRVPMGVRGISSVSNEGTAGLSSGVAIMIDGVPIPSDSRAGTAVEDIQSIEILKGPQATLGGRTAAQGVINMVTRRPSDTFTGDISVSATDDNEYRASGFIAGPISESVQYSLAGYYTNREFPIKNLITGFTTEEKVYGARGKLLFKPTENLDILLAAHYGRDDTKGANFVYTHTTPGAYLLLGTALPPYGLPTHDREFLESVLSQPVLLPGITANFDNHYYASPLNAPVTVKDDDYMLDIQYRLGNLTLGSTTAYQHEKQVNTQDLFLVATHFFNNLTGFPGCNADGTGPIPCFGNKQIVSYDNKQFSEELKLLSPTDQTVSYLVGAFFSDTKIDLAYQRYLAPAYVVRNVVPDTKTTDLYGRVTWKFAPQWAAVAGLRYNYDQVSYDSHNEQLGPPVPDFSDSFSESTTVGDLSLQFKFNPDSMAYLTYARGYSPAAFNTAQTLQFDASGAPIPYEKAKKEDVDHFELGSKGRYLDGRLSVDAALFYTVYKDFQVQIFDQTSGQLSPPLILTNAGKAETKGVELDVSFAATNNLRLNFNAAYIDAKFKEYLGAPCYYPDSSGIVPAGSACFQDLNGNNILDSGEPTAGQALQTVLDANDNEITPGVVQSLSGKTTPNSPKFKFVVGAEQRVPLSFGDITLGANYSWRDKAQMLVDQNPYGIQPSFGILNLNLGWQSADKKLSATLFCNNVFDEHYFTDLEDFWSAPWGGVNTIVGQPARDSYRYFGLRLKAGF